VQGYFSDIPRSEVYCTVSSSVSSYPASHTHLISVSSSSTTSSSAYGSRVLASTPPLTSATVAIVYVFPHIVSLTDHLTRWRSIVRANGVGTMAEPSPRLACSQLVDLSPTCSTSPLSPRLSTPVTLADVLPRCAGPRQSGSPPGYILVEAPKPSLQRRIISVGLRQRTARCRILSGKLGLDTSLNRLPSAVKTPFNLYRRQHTPTCLPKTRIDVLRELYNWVGE
jgi:hypothetical protein